MTRQRGEKCVIRQIDAAQDVALSRHAALGRQQMTGRHVAPFAGVEPAGAAVDLLLVDILRIRDGRIAAITAYLDSAALRRQLLVPAAMG